MIYILAVLEKGKLLANSHSCQNAEKCLSIHHKTNEEDTPLEYYGMTSSFLPSYILPKFVTNTIHNTSKVSLFLCLTVGLFFSA